MKDNACRHHFIKQELGVFKFYFHAKKRDNPDKCSRAATSDKVITFTLSIHQISNPSIQSH